jgi:hypothetical protein
MAPGEVPDWYTVLDEKNVEMDTAGNNWEWLNRTVGGRFGFHFGLLPKLLRSCPINLRKLIRARPL